MKKLFWSIVFLSAFAFAMAAGAQPARKVPQIGYLTERAGPTIFDEAFRQGLRDYGYVEGHSINVEYRWGNGNADRMPDMTAALIALNVDVIVTAGTPAALAAKRATTKIPIVMLSVPDAVGLGLVASMARPGGNVTGQSTFASELAGKRLQILKEAIPGLSRVGLLFNAANPSNVLQFKESEAAALLLGLQVQPMEARFPEDLEGVFAAAAKWGAGGVVILSDGATIRHRSEIGSLALRHKLATMFANKAYLEGGGLMSYGPDILGVYRRGAAHVDRILKGANPGDLAFEQPTNFEFAINLKAAKALGFTIPRPVLQRANQLIE